MRIAKVVVVMVVGGLGVLGSALPAAANVNLAHPSFDDPLVDPNSFFPAVPDITGWAEIDPMNATGNNSTGVFLNQAGPQFVANIDGDNQAAFIDGTTPSQLTDIDGIAIWQVSNDRFEAGKSYKVSAWFGKGRHNPQFFASTPDDNALLAVRLFYQPDGDDTLRALDDSVLVGTWNVRAGDLNTEFLTMMMWISDEILPRHAAENQRIGIALTPIDFTPSDTPPEPGLTTSFTVDQVNIDIIPEPTTLALIALGGLAMLRRRVE